MEQVGKGIERDGKREIRVFCEERRCRKTQDRPSKAQDVMATRRRAEINPKSEVGNHEFQEVIGY
jgi:hypothetical protein